MNRRRFTYPQPPSKSNCNCLHDILNLYEIINRLENEIKNLTNRIQELERRLNEAEPSIVSISPFTPLPNNIMTQNTKDLAPFPNFHDIDFVKLEEYEMIEP